MTDSSRKITKNIVSLLLREGSSKGVYVLLSMLIAHRFGKEMLGQYVLAFLIPRLFFMLSEMGLNTFFVREVSKDRKRLFAYTVNTGFLKTVFGALSFLGVLVIARLLYPVGPLFRLIGLCALSYFLINYLQFMNAAFRSAERMEIEAKVTIARDLLFLVLSLLWIWKGAGLATLFLFFLIANGLGVGFGAWEYRKLFGSPSAPLDIAFCRRMLKEAKPIWLISLVSLLYLYIDSVMLSLMKGPSSVGLYHTAYLFVDFFVLFSTIFTAAFFPIFSRQKEDVAELRKSYGAVFKLAFFCLFPLQLLLFLFADRTLLFFFGSSFQEAATALRILATGGFLFGIGSVNAHCLLACGEELFVVKGMVAFLFINIVLNFLWIPRFSFNGSSVATVLCEALVFGTFFIKIRSLILKKAL